MGLLLGIFIGLSVFGAGVTLVDMLGALDHGHDDSHDDSHDDVTSLPLSHAEPGAEGSLMGVDERRLRRVGRAIQTLRNLVYFSLGAGPMGWIALARGEGMLESLLWALVSGFLIAVLARVLRRLIRRELDSSLKPSDYLMENAEVIVPILEGELGKIRARKFGVESELYARMKTGQAPKGSLVRIVDYDAQSYIVEKKEAEHG